jgi:hypothetical protein
LNQRPTETNQVSKNGLTLNGKYFHDIACVPLVALRKSWPLMCVDVCGDVCVCGGDASYGTNGTQAMAPKWSPTLNIFMSFIFG